MTSRAELEADSRVVWTEDVLRYGDTDANGHINNSTYSVLCESGRVNLFQTRLVPLMPEGRYFVIVRLAIDFRAELFYPGTVRTATWLSHMGRTSLTVEQALFSGETLAATSEGVCVVMDAATRRPTPVPDEARAVVGAMLRGVRGVRT
jgi:acyl-CoA thioester hydrolase